METLHQKDRVASFLQSIGAAAQRVFMLDYDGTLAPFRDNHENAPPYAGIPEALNALLEQRSTRLIIVSGRSIDSLLKQLNGLRRLPEMWGAHGLERRMPDGAVITRPISDDAATGLSKARSWAESEFPPGRCEFKPAGIAFHWRGLDRDSIPIIAEKIRQGMAALLATGALQLTSFDGGLELRVADVDKGHAVRTLLSELDPRAAIAYAGDDLTDEDAFRALGDRGLRILVRATYRPTLADVWLRPPDEMIQFLYDWLRACGATS